MTITVVRPQQPSPAPAPEDRPTTQLRKRDRYIDSLRSLALIRVMTYHVFGWAWLPILFPSIGIMFALAGSLVAGSLDRSPGNPWRVLKKRGIRLLPPVWLFGLVAVPIMLVAGWTHSDTAGDPLSWQTMLFWIVPISDPPASTFGVDWVLPLWYIRSYLWFLLLSPALLWLFRHWPKRMLALPVTVVLLSALGLLPLDGRSGDVILSTAMFGGCWMLGFAHHDNKIRALPLTGVLIGGASLMALGLAWAFTHLDPVSSYDIDNIPMADTLYCLGAVLILLRLYPDFSWMDKRVVLDKIVTVINSRAMTIYLWGNFAIFLSNPILDLWSVTRNLDQNNAVGWLQMYLASWLLIVASVFMFGWCEDLAARRRLRINPWPRSKQQLETMRTRKVLTFPHPTWLAEMTPRRLFIVTSCLLAAAGAVSAAALAGTNTPGQTTPADIQPRYAVNPRPNTKPPANLGQGNGQAIASVPHAPTVTQSQRSRVLPPAADGAPMAWWTTTTAPTHVPTVPARVPTIPTRITTRASATKTPAPAVTTPPVTTPPVTTPPVTTPPVTTPPVTTPPVTTPPVTTPATA
jgi:peptidoglycan/LPS O-acetylase OafA/YrhL